MEVRKIMTKNPACCTADSTLQEVAHMMEMYDCGCIPVVEDHKTAKPIGTITDRDIAIRSVAEGRNASEMTAADVMTTDIATVTPEMSIEECRDQMEERQIRRILVVDKTGRCVGIVAQADLVSHESNARQTAEFVRDVSQPNHSTVQNNVSTHEESHQDFSSRTQHHDDAPRASLKQPSPNRSFSERGKKSGRSQRGEKSYFGGSLLLPLAIGVGAGAALKYFMPQTEKAQTTFVPREQVTSSAHTHTHTHAEATPDVLLEVPRDAADIHIEGDFHASTEKSETALSDAEQDMNLELGRTAKS